MKQRIIRADANDGVTPRQRENRELARAAAREGIVLLKNDGAAPVKPGRIALYGAGASRTVKGGTGSGEVNERHTVTILEGLELAGYEIASYGWIRDFEAECREAEECWRQERGAQGAGLMNSMVQPFMPPAGRVITDADIAASACDTAIYVVARQAGEGADKKLKNDEFDLSPAETESILKMAAGYKNSVLVINSGSYMDIGTLDEAVSAVVWFCQQGMEGGAALADILSGRGKPQRQADRYMGAALCRRTLRHAVQLPQRRHHARILPRGHICRLSVLRQLRDRAALPIRLRPVIYEICAEHGERDARKRRCQCRCPCQKYRHCARQRGRSGLCLRAAGELKRRYQRLAGFKNPAPSPPARRRL